MKFEAIKIVCCHLKTLTKHFYINFILLYLKILLLRGEEKKQLSSTKVTLGQNVTALNAISYMEFSFIKIIIVRPLLYTVYINELFQLNLNL